MTLHWWMHWFWVTSLLAGLLLATPVPSTTENPRRPIEATEEAAIIRIAEVRRPVSVPESDLLESTPSLVQREITGRPSARRKEETTTTPRSSTPGNLSVLPLRVEAFRLVVDRTIASLPNSNREEDVDDFGSIDGTEEELEIDRELAEPRLAADQIAATAASVLFQPGIGESTRLSRARNVFASQFRDREIDRSSEILEVTPDESVRRDIATGTAASSTLTILDIAAIAGSCLATVLLIGTMASFGFVMYRRKYLNPPQTLNSDKCSNPDSSGYIDDSTIRDNSEEMYSLDNDSFLNSLEAMTIQNYWTDSVKHTKL